MAGRRGLDLRHAAQGRRQDRLVVGLWLWRLARLRHARAASALSETIDGTSYGVSTTYDAAGRPATASYPNGLVAQSVYSATGHLSQVKNAGSGLVYWQALTVDARGNVTSSRLGNGVESAKTYEAATGFLTGIRATAPVGVGGTIQDLAYTFDRLGNLGRRQDTLSNLDETFAYDTLNRVVEVATISTPLGGGAATTSTVAVTYNRMGNITSRSDVGTYTYGGTGSLPPGGLGVGGPPTDPNCGIASLRPHAVTGVAGAKNAAYCYDANGDLTSGDGRSVTWSAFGMPTRVAKGLRSIDLAYGPDRARFKRIDSNETGLSTTHYVAGGSYEAVIASTGSVNRRVYVGGAAIVIDTETLPGVTTPAETRYLLRDHLGSIDAILDSNGAVLERLSFDAWGKRRKTDWTSYGSADPGYLWQGKPVTRGFTGHEELDPVGLVHMNGRVYDPEIGRFLSADAVIQDATNLQSLNAYSYVLNNPLSLTDPTGFFFKSLFRAIGNAIRSVFRAIGAVFKAVLKSSIGRALIQIVACANPAAAITCGATAAALTLQAGGSILDAVKAGAFAFAQMYVWPAVHGLGEVLRTTGTLAHSVVHGVVSGALSVAQGGSFLQGFASGAIGQTAGLASESVFGPAGTGDWGAGRTVVAATGGGLGSLLVGDKFENGAVTAAFAQIWNGEAGRLAGQIAGGSFGENLPLPDPLGVIVGAKVGGAIGSALEDLVTAATTGNTNEDIYYHYTNEAGYDVIMKTRLILPSTGEKNTWHGVGVYVTKILPGTWSSGSLARSFKGIPNQEWYTHYVAIETTGLTVTPFRKNAYVIPTVSPLNISGRLRGHGKN